MKRSALPLAFGVYRRVPAWAGNCGRNMTRDHPWLLHRFGNRKRPQQSRGRSDLTVRKAACRAGQGIAHEKKNGLGLQLTFVLASLQFRVQIGSTTGTPVALPPTQGKGECHETTLTTPYIRRQSERGESPHHSGTGKYTVRTAA